MINIFLFINFVFAFTGRCTYHDYEGGMMKLGPEAYDNAPGWCGIRYSSLDLTRVMAINGINEGGCNKCYQVSSPYSSLYILAIDYKADPGLDISKSGFQALFPNDDPLNPQVCDWQEVDFSFCADICNGVKEECSLGVRNLLPASILKTYSNDNGNGSVEEKCKKLYRRRLRI